MVSNKYVNLNKNIYNALSMRLRFEYEIMLLDDIYDRERKREREQGQNNYLLLQTVMIL